jgi:hypothetical protein
VKGLSEQGEDFAAFAQLMDAAYKSKGSSFPIESYGVRLFLRFVPENGVNLLRGRSFESSLHSIFADNTPSDVQSLKFSTRYGREKFSDSIELDASLKDVQLRYSRDAVGTNFASYRTFLNAVGFKDIIEDLRPLCEALVAAPRKQGGLRRALSDLR